MSKICDVEIKQTVTSSSVGGTLGERCAIISNRTNVSYSGLTYGQPPSSALNVIYQPEIGSCSVNNLRQLPHPSSGVWAITLFSSDQGSFGLLMFGTGQNSLSISTNSPVINSNCRCTNDSCQIDCATSPNGFCCIPHSVTNRLLQVLAN